MIDNLFTFVAANANSIGEILGFVAGLIVIYSSLPTVRAQLTDPYPGTPDQRQGHLYLAIGNATLAVACVLTGTVSVMIMAIVNASIRIVIWSRMIRLAKKFHNNTAATTAPPDAVSST